MQLFVSSFSWYLKSEIKKARNNGLNPQSFPILSLSVKEYNGVNDVGRQVLPEPWMSKAVGAASTADARRLVFPVLQPTGSRRLLQAGFLEACTKKQIFRTERQGCRMELIIYRGTHEIGGTMIELKTRGTRILLDAGYPLYYKGEIIDESWVKKPAKELLELGVIPQVKGLYQWDQPKFDAVILSHAHSDHYGLLKYIHPKIPVYLTEAAETLISLSLSFPIPKFRMENTMIFYMEKPFQIGDFFLKPYLMDHSAFDAAAFEIRAEGKTLIYSADFRNHGWKGYCLENFLQKAPKYADLLLVEGTNIGRKSESLPSESDVQQKVEAILKDSEGIVLFQASTQNVDRMISFYQAAEAQGKFLVVDVYVANLLSQLTRPNYRLPVPGGRYRAMKVFYPFPLGRLWQTKGREILCSFLPFIRSRISMRKISKKQKCIVMMVRPSMLSDLKKIELDPGDFIYSMWQAYRGKGSQVRFEKYLSSLGFQSHLAHTSGHASEAAIKQVIAELHPKRVIPIHTFHPEAFFAFSDKTEVFQDSWVIKV